MKRAFRWLCLLAVLAAGCGGESRAECEPLASASSRFPSETLEDWRSYADHLATLKVRSISERSGTALPLAALEVTDVLWSANGAPRLPNRFEWRVLPGRFQQGDSLLSPVVYVEDGGRPGWDPLGVCSALLLDDGRVAAADSDELRRRFSEKSPRQVASALRAQKPSPLAARYANLRPVKRVEAVSKAGGFNSP